MTPIPRRTLLRGAAGAAIALPFLEAMLPRRATAAPTAQKRFIVMFSPNGTIAPNWSPTRGATGAETDFALSPILTPFAPHQADLVIVEGLNQQGGGGDGHQNGIGGMLTGAPLNSGPFAGVGAPPAGWATGPSVDQRIAEGLAAPTQLRSLELGVQVGDADNWGRMCYRAADQPLVPTDDPAAVYASVFSDLHTDPGLLARLRKRRQSILDTVGGQYSRLASQLGSADRTRLDQHLAAVREIETRLTSDWVVSNAACQDPKLMPVASQANDSFPAVGALQMDLMTMALACDLTRVASLQWSRSVSQVQFTWLGISEGHHDLSHRSDSDLAAIDKLTRINTWYASQLASLLQRLKDTPSGSGGTLFDGTLILWCNELAKGNTHSRLGAHYLLAAIREGRCERAATSATTASRCRTTICCCPSSTRWASRTLASENRIGAPAHWQDCSERRRRSHEPNQDPFRAGGAICSHGLQHRSQHQQTIQRDCERCRYGRRQGGERQSPRRRRSLLR